jgi:glycosyltransferase involved in cell wall biosynthesis
MKSVLILQGRLVNYRQPLFNLLSEHYEVTVLHSGTPCKRPTDKYAEVIVPQKKRGPFHIQDISTVRKHMRDFDAVIAMFDIRWPAYILPVFDSNRPKYIFHGHRYSGKFLADRARDFLMKRADRVLLYGEEEVAQIIKGGLAPDRIVIAPNTIDVPNHQDLSGSPKDSLLYVGRLQDRKRLDVAIEAFANLQGKIPAGIEFNIVGAGEPEAELRDQAQALGISDKVNFLGQIDDPEQLKELFGRAIAYISPGPVGLAVLHSFAYGVPVITLREGYHGPEFHNLVHGENSIIVDGADNYEQAMLSVCQDSGYARKLGGAAYDLFRNTRTIDHLVAGFRTALETS